MTIRMAWVLAVGGLGFVLAAGTSQAQLSPCPSGGNCVQVTVGSGSGNVGDTVQIPITFNQGPDDSADGGVDAIAAIAFSVGLSGLELADCSNPDANGITPAIIVPTAVSDSYRVVIENTSCTDRDRCLCPGTGQTRDDFINVVVFGPKDLPAPGSGPVDIPLLPDGELLTVGVKSSGVSGTLPLHVYAETDDQGTTPKPQFGAFLSVGDDQAVDQTADRDANESKVAITDGQVEIAGVAMACACDCNMNGRTTGTEITSCVLILGGTKDISECPAADSDHNDRVSGTDITRGVIALGVGTACTPF